MHRFFKNPWSFVILCSAVYCTYGCLTEWQFHEGYCYLYKREHFTFFQAKVTCGILGGNVVEIRSAHENDFVKNFIRSHAGDTTWIALEDLGQEGKFVWYTNQDTPNYTNWYYTEPNDWDHNEDCVTTRADGLWFDWDCATRHPFICQMEGRDGELIG